MGASTVAHNVGQVETLHKDNHGVSATATHGHTRDHLEQRLDRLIDVANCIAVGQQVSPADRHNVGTVVAIDDTAGTASIHFASRDGHGVVREGNHVSEYTLPDLDFDYSALEPHISGEINELHHSKHHATYVAGANTALEKLAAAREAEDHGSIFLLEKKYGAGPGSQ